MKSLLDELADDVVRRCLIAAAGGLAVGVGVGYLLASDKAPTARSK